MNGALDRHALLWQDAIAAASKVYTATAQADSRYEDLQDRMRASALRLATSLAQAGALSRRSERLSVLNSAAGTLAELETQTHIAIELEILDPKLSLASHVARLRTALAAMIRSLQEQRSRDMPPTWQVRPHALGSTARMIDRKTL
jgi:four helix bundle protein